MSSDGNNSKNIAPFTIFSSSAEGGYLTELHTNFTGGVEINNLHTDTYGEFRHPPAQGTFTNKFVGGSPHRHNAVGSTDRVEAFSITFETPISFLFESTETEITPIAGAPTGTDLMFELDGFGGVQPLDPPADSDAVWELDVDDDITPGNGTGAGILTITKPTRPVLYRDEFAKRPINIRNIRQQSPGNFSHTREIVHTAGRTLNPGQARAAAYSVTYPLFPSNENAVLNVDGDTGNLAEYAMPELSSSASAHVFVNRFSSPGDRYTMSRGFLNPIGEEYSAYNTMPFRNLNVRVENDENMKVHNAQFAANHHPVNRNTGYKSAGSPLYDNGNVTHAIPQNTLQYSWITASAEDTIADFQGFATGSDLSFHSGTIKLNLTPREAMNSHSPLEDPVEVSAVYTNTTPKYADYNSQTGEVYYCAIFGMGGGFIYAVDDDGNSTTVLDPSTITSSPWAIKVVPSEDKLYWTEYIDKKIMYAEISDPSTNGSVATGLIHPPYHIEVSGNTAYYTAATAFGPDLVKSIDLTSPSETVLFGNASVTNLDEFTGIRFDESTNKLYFIGNNAPGNNVTVGTWDINSSTLSILKTDITTIGEATDMQLNTSNRTMFIVATQAGESSIYRMSMDQESDPILVKTLSGLSDMINLSFMESKLMVMTNTVNPHEIYTISPEFTYFPLNSVYLDEDNNTQDFDLTGSVYGYSTWKQVRGGELKLSRHYRENSILAAANNEDIITQFSEPAIVAKHKPLEHVIGIDETSEDYVVKSPYGNELVRHSNEELNQLFAFTRSDHGTTYTQLKDNYINRSIDDPANPVKRFVSMTYGETVFPRSKNAFKSKVRIRGNYTEVAGTGENGYDRRFGSQNTMYSSTGRRSSSALNSQGLLTYALAFDPMKTDGANSFLSAPGHNGNVGEMNYDFDETHFVIDPDGYVRPHLNFFETNHAYVASTDTDYNERLVEEMSGKTRWYDSYDLYQENSRGLLPEASVIPEFRISEHMDYYIEDAAGNFRADNKKFLTLLGHENSSSAAARASVNFDTDFEDTILDSEKIEHFDKIKKDHTGHSRPRKLTLTAAGVKKLLPYNGFYPDTRTVQLGNLLSQSIAPNIQGYLTVPGNPSKAEQFLDTDPVQGHAAILKTIASPGILYNTTKAGLAVDYPIYTSQPETASLSGNPTNVLVLSSDVTASTRLPFETLVNLNENLPRDERVFLVGAHPHQTTDDSFASSSLYYGKWNGKKKPYFEIASHNYLAESVNFFLKNSEVSSFISKPQNEFAEVEADKTYYMDVVLRDEVQMNRFAEYSGVTSSFPTHEVIEANLDLEFALGDKASTSTAVAQDNQGGAYVLFGMPEQNRAYLTHTNQEGNSTNLSEDYLTGASNQLYGTSVAMQSGSNGLYLAIGAPENEGLSTTGSIYTYRYTPAGLEFLGNQDSPTTSCESYGSSVSLVSGSDAVYYATCTRHYSSGGTDRTLVTGHKYKTGSFGYLNGGLGTSSETIEEYSGSCSVAIASGSSMIAVAVGTTQLSGADEGHVTILTSSAAATPYHPASPDLLYFDTLPLVGWQPTAVSTPFNYPVQSISAISTPTSGALAGYNSFFFLVSSIATPYPFSSHEMFRMVDWTPLRFGRVGSPFDNTLTGTGFSDIYFQAYYADDYLLDSFDDIVFNTSLSQNPSDPFDVMIAIPAVRALYGKEEPEVMIKNVALHETHLSFNPPWPTSHTFIPKAGYGDTNAISLSRYGAGIDIDMNSSLDPFVSTGMPTLDSEAGSVHLVYSAPRRDVYSQHGRLFGSPLDRAYDPAYSQYTPPGFHGERIATISFSSSVGGITSLEEILKSSTVADSEAIKEGQTSKFSGENVSLSTDEQSAKMPIESSVSLFGKTKQPDVEFQISETGETTRVDRAKSAGASAFRWAISTKYECPVIDVSSSLYADNYTSHLADENDAVWGFSGSSGQFSHPRSVWTSHGQATAPDKGYFFELRESTSKGANDGSLVELCGFTPGTKKIGSVADNKVISEAIMVVPYTSQAIKNKTVEIESGKHFFRLNNSELKRQKRSVEDNGYAISEDLRETSISELIQGMKDYVIPPHYNFLQYKDIKPFACYFLEFEHTLSQRDLIDIWQGITPSIALNPETEEVEISHDINKHNLFHNIDIPTDIKFMIFKVKKQAMWNYYDITTDSTDDNRFRFDFQGDGKVEVVPEYNYNWPYDFFSLVERAKVDVDITFKKEDEEE